MIEALKWGLLNFIVYLTPLYLFMLNSLNESYHQHDLMEKVFHPSLVTLFVVLIGFIFVRPIWNNPFIFLIYIFTFFIIYYYLSRSMAYLPAFTIAILSVFAVSEIWQIPIKVQALLISGFEDQLRILFMSFFKMVSIPLLVYYAKHWKWKKSNGFYLISIIISVLLFLQTRFYYPLWWTEINGIIMRILIGLTIIMFSLGFKKVYK